MSFQLNNVNSASIQGFLNPYNLRKDESLVNNYQKKKFHSPIEDNAKNSIKQIQKTSAVSKLNKLPTKDKDLQNSNIISASIISCSSSKKGSKSSDLENI